MLWVMLGAPVNEGGSWLDISTVPICQNKTPNSLMLRISIFILASPDDFHQFSLSVPVLMSKYGTFCHGVFSNESAGARQYWSIPNCPTAMCQVTPWTSPKLKCCVVKPELWSLNYPNLSTRDLFPPVLLCDDCIWFELMNAWLGLKDTDTTGPLFISSSFMTSTLHNCLVPPNESKICSTLCIGS